MEKSKMKWIFSVPVMLLLGFVTCGAAALPLSVVRIRKYPAKRGGGIVVLVLSALYLAMGIFIMTLPEVEDSGKPADAEVVAVKEGDAVTAEKKEQDSKDVAAMTAEAEETESSAEEVPSEKISVEPETEKITLDEMLAWLEEYGFDLRFIPDMDDDCIRTMYVYTKSMAKHRVESMEALQEYSMEYLDEPVYNDNFTAVYRYVLEYSATTFVDEDIDKLAKELFGDEADAIFERAHDRFYPEDAVKVTYIHSLERGETVSNTGGKSKGEIYLEAFYAANYLEPEYYYELDTDNYIEYCRNLENVGTPVRLVGEIETIKNDYAYMVVHVKDSVYVMDDWHARIDTTIILDCMPVVMNGDWVDVYGVYIGLDSNNKPIIAAVEVDLS